MVSFEISFITFANILNFSTQSLKTVNEQIALDPVAEARAPNSKKIIALKDNSKILYCDYKGPWTCRIKWEPVIVKIFSIPW